MICTHGEQSFAEHEADEGGEMKRSQCLGQSFIVLDEPPEARCPGEAALDDPAARQQHDAALGFLDRLGQGGYLGSIRLIGRGHVQRQEVRPRVSTTACTSEPYFRLRPS